MKKYRLFLLVLSIVLSLFALLAMSGCKTDETVIAEYLIKYETDGNGTIMGEATQTVIEGKDCSQVTAVPDEGYEFVNWSDGLTTPERQDKNVTEDKTITAQFKKKAPVEPEPVKEYTIRYTVDVGGYIDGATVQTIKENESAKVVFAVPETGYKFVKWSDGVTTPERQDKNIIAEKTVTAEFVKIKFTVTYSTGVGGTIDGTVEQEIEYGNDAEFVVAVPDEGYRFLRWSDGNGSAIRKETNVTSEINVTAEFEFLYADGNGSISNPFLIKTYTQLINIWYYPESNYKLINDLDLSEIKHEPVFDDNIYFNGIFNGDGYTIKNLTVETEINYPSLFGVIDGGIISGLNFENANIKTTDFDTTGNNKYCIGILAGKASGFIKNITVNGKINVDGLSYDGVAIGGLVGLANGTFDNCFCDVQVNVKNVISKNSTFMNLPFVFGGVIGVGDSVFINHCNTEGKINITECYWTENGSTGDMNKYSDILVGGMVGYYFTDKQVKADIKDSHTNVSINGDNHYEAGGFIGNVNIAERTSLNIVDSSVSGDIEIGIVGGFVCRGYSYGKLNIENCYVKNQITAYSRAAGFLARFTGNNHSILNKCYAECKIITHRLGEPNVAGGEAFGFGYQVSGTNYLDCYSIFDIDTLRGAGFAYLLTNCALERCYAKGVFGEFSTAYNGLFVKSLSSSQVRNCYIKSNVNESQDKKNIFVFTNIKDSSVTNFYYAGSDVENIVYRISDSQINNFHLLRSSTQEFEYVAQDTGSNPSVLDITLYSETKAMYYLADKLNVGQDKDVWINVLNNYPKLKTETNS